MNLETALLEWQRLLGDVGVLDANTTAARYGADTNAIARSMLAALRPTSAPQVVEVMRIAYQHGVAVHPVSTGHNWGYGTALPTRDGCVLLDLSGMDRIVDFDADLGVVTLEPGVTQAQLAKFLADGGHPYLVPVTGAGPQCSLIGNALERGYGVTPHSDHFGAVTDLTAVLADGSTCRSALSELGGDDIARLFKWGIGPYTAGLFTQSGFGIVTRMSIALARRPACVQVCLFSLKDDHLLEPAVAAIHLALSQTGGVVGAINLMNQHRVLAMAAPYPHADMGPHGVLPANAIAALGRRYQILPWTGFCTLYGTRRIVAAAAKELRSALSRVSSRMVFLSPDGAARLASLARVLPGMGRIARTAGTLAQSLELVAGRPNETALPLAYWRLPPDRQPSAQLQGQGRDPARDGCGLIWYPPLVPQRPATVRAYVDMVTSTTPRFGIEPLITLTSLNDRVFDSTVPILFDRAAPGAVAAARNCYSALFEAGRALGCVPYRIASDQHGYLGSLLPAAMAFTRKLQHALDPQGLIAPGRYGHSAAGPAGSA